MGNTNQNSNDLSWLGVTSEDIIEAGAGTKVKPLTFTRGFTDIPDYLLSVSIKVGDFSLEANLRDILYYGRDDFSELDDREIDKALDASSEFRISIGVAFAYLTAELEEAEHDLSFYEAQVLDASYERIIEEKKSIQGKVTQATLQATREEKIAEHISDPARRKKWNDLKIKVINLRRDVNIVRKVDDVLKDRTMLLMSISKRRFSERTGKFEG